MNGQHRMCNCMSGCERKHPTLSWIVNRSADFATPEDRSISSISDKKKFSWKKFENQQNKVNQFMNIRDDAVCVGGRGGVEGGGCMLSYARIQSGLAANTTRSSSDRCLL